MLALSSSAALFPKPCNGSKTQVNSISLFPWSNENSGYFSNSSHTGEPQINIFCYVHWVFHILRSICKVKERGKQRNHFISFQLEGSPLERGKET